MEARPGDVEVVTVRSSLNAALKRVPFRAVRLRFRACIDRAASRPSFAGGLRLRSMLRHRHASRRQLLANKLNRITNCKIQIVEIHRVYKERQRKAGLVKNVLFMTTFDVFKMMCKHIHYKKLYRFFTPCFSCVFRIRKAINTVKNCNAGEECMPGRVRISLIIGKCRLNN